MKIEITDNDRMVIFLASLGNITEHMTVPQMKEQIKQFGVAAEIFEDALVPFLPKVLFNFQKRIKEEGSTRLHTTIAETIGLMVWHILDKSDPDQQEDVFLNQFMGMPLAILDKSNNKVVQSGSIACLTKIIINCPDDILFENIEDITDKLVSIFKTKLF